MIKKKKKYWTHPKHPGKKFHGDYQSNIKKKITEFFLDCYTHAKIKPIKFRSWQSAIKANCKHK